MPRVRAVRDDNSRVFCVTPHASRDRSVCAPGFGAAGAATAKTHTRIPSHPHATVREANRVTGAVAALRSACVAAPVGVVPSAQQMLQDIPADSPVRILDERGHLRTLEEIERDLIQHAIEIYSGHMSEVARRLGIGRSTLYRKVRE